MVGLIRSICRTGLQIVLPIGSIVALVAAVCWLIGWRTVDQYVVALLIAGVLIFLLGTLGGAAGRTTDTHAAYLLASTVSLDDLETRTRRDRAEVASGVRAMLLGALVAGGVFVVAFAVQWLVP